MVLGTISENFRSLSRKLWAFHEFEIHAEIFMNHQHNDESALS